MPKQSRTEGKVSNKGSKGNAVQPTQPTHHTEPKPSHPVRTCAGCQKRGDSSMELVRVVLGADGTSAALPQRGQRDEAKGARGVVVDVASSAFGRGAHVHPEPACVKKACSGGFARAFRCAIAAGAPLAVLASNAGANATKTFGWAVAEGRAVAWKDKATLGTLLGRDEVAVVVIRDAGIAGEFMRVRAVASSALAR